jgi:hypothetical protein
LWSTGRSPQPRPSRKTRRLDGASRVGKSRLCDMPNATHRGSHAKGGLFLAGTTGDRPELMDNKILVAMSE